MSKKCLLNSTVANVQTTCNSEVKSDDFNTDLHRNTQQGLSST